MKIINVLIGLLLFSLNVAAQIGENIKVNFRNVTLSRVLLDLKENYDFQFAFDNDLLSKYKISVNKTFSSKQETLQYLIKDLPLVLEKSGDVFLIIPQKKSKNTVREVNPTQITGQVLEATTYEPLPFSYILINQKPIQSDRQGHFTYYASADTSFDVRISHLGYFIYDTIVTQSLNKKFLLIPQIERIAEVKVRGNPVAKSTLIGDKAGRIKINHQIAPILPGHGDNSIFNLLRLMPGILAAGEQSADLLIWGSYESHSKIQFDGYTIFGLKNFNDNISVVNPFLVKSIEVFKGGYEARYGGRVGGIVDIVGKNGSTQPTFTFNINTTTVNSMAEIPLSKKSTLLAAYRQTYYQLYDPTSLNLFKKRSSDSALGTDEGIDFRVVPNYSFRDANLKYTLNGDNGSQFFASFYGGGDKFLYNMEGDYFFNKITRHEQERNKQLAAAINFNKPWKNGSITNVALSYSVFELRANEKNQTNNTRTNRHKISKNITSDNNVDELTFKTEHTTFFEKGHKLITGAGVVNNRISLLRKSFENEVINIDSESPRFFAFAQDELPVANFLELKTGLRVVRASQLKNWYAEPRISATLKFSEAVRLNLSWGLYNQFMAKTSVVDSAYNFSYFWTNSNNYDIPVLHAEHWVGGVTINTNGFTLSAETYYKTTTGITRFFNGTKNLDRGFYEGQGRSYGLDLYLKKEYKRHMAWVSYTLSKTEELFPFYFRNQYKLAPHHQTHELKLAAITNFKAFYISANYVYGSGFERYSAVTQDGTKLNQPYKRLDAAVVYKLPAKKINGELGLSVLNVLNYQNIKYSNLRHATVDEINLVGIYAEAVPFTPAVFLKLQF